MAHARIYNTQSILQRRHGLPPTQQHHSPSINHTLNPGAAPRLETNRTSTKRGTQQRAAARAQPLHALRPRSSLRSLSAYRQDSCLYRTRGACVRKTWLQKHMGPAHLWRPAVQGLQGPARGGGRCVHPGARPRSPAILRAHTLGAAADLRADAQECARGDGAPAAPHCKAGLAASGSWGAARRDAAPPASLMVVTFALTAVQGRSMRAPQPRPKNARVVASNAMRAHNTQPP